MIRLKPRDVVKIGTISNQIQNNIPLNQILYGPPGTGKTYTTIDKALEILGKSTEDKSREKLKQIFDDYKNKGQIEFVTFHQSYGYEDFVEGIVPKLDSEDGGKIEYELKDGIFKRICKRAFIGYIGDLLEKYKKERVGKGIELKTETQNKIFDVTPDKDGYLLEAPQERKEGSKFYKIRKKILVDVIYEIKFKGVEKLSDLSVGKGNKSSYFAIAKDVIKFAEDNNIPIQKSDTKKPYILIIDEINRGNISKIFGELITLIEESKRYGNSESLEVTLPYSQDTFSVPNNLYIIGTMNTADRSIVVLDTALRRRFSFTEMMPDPSVLNKDCDGVNLAELLKSINERIEFLYDREHTIGHSFFIGVDSIDKLRFVFKDKIIPLLQEYFYDDYEKINLVLNNNGMIKSKEAKKPDYCKNLKSSEFVIDKKIYEITHKWDEETFRKIYGSNEADSEVSQDDKSTDQ